ncbi:unnamed protein product [Aphanomyces euteiches]|uniref:Uncharacterized protein n=1 Tax=Aphanomyces euteiches TaxID=100861 RepID=A0A6G0W9J4_9STRA|nr:hypothetical protein Ae201684_017362 [Aphanomyces euteiches]KAH9088629.1 hypothetical protein Ae201684P_017238 [Aphanomyces euteiches]
MGSATVGDSSEKEKLAQECIDLLVKHGYHRASLEEIPIYERVVGGLVFCLQSEDLTSVDCDILFRPVATVKERVRVAEAICHSFNTALISYAKTNVSSPLTLSVHELQGANYAKLKQVVAWLVQHTQIKLNTRVTQAINTQWNAIMPKGEPVRKTPSPWYRITRQTKFQGKAVEAMSEQERIQRCLLEYGEKMHSAAPESYSDGRALQEALAQRSSSVDEEFDRRFQSAAKEALASEQRALIEQKRQEEQLLQEAIAASEDGQWCLHPPAVNNQALQAAVELYDATSESIQARWSSQDATAFGWLAEKRKFERQRFALRGKLDSQTTQLHKMKQAHEEAQAEIHRLESVEATVCATINSLERKQEQMELLEAGRTNAKELHELRSLITQHTSLKLQETQFKASCNEKLAELQAQVAALPLETNQELHPIERKHERMVQKRNELKSALAKESQAILAAMRRIDDIPSRSELIQYEKRFSELYEEVALTLDETRKYYSIYNTLERTHEFLEKEVALIESINSNFQVALSSREACDLFFSQINDIISNIRDNVAKQQAILQTRQLAVDTLDSKYQLLLEKQQAYVAAIREFQKECEKNTKLANHLESLRQ